MTRWRDTLLSRLATERFDVLVIGGGIVGAGIARDAALRGLTVALIEQGDFAGGTSSKTSKLIHGGLRYLEHGHLRLVGESLRERHILRTIAPGLVWPISLLLPVYAGDRRSAWKICAGLWLYDRLAWRWNIRPHQILSPRGALAQEPALRAEGLRLAGRYADCQMDDARLCLANVLQAVNLGAVCGNYLRLVSLLKADHRVAGGAVEDRLSGRTMEVQAQVVVNATGPWSDQVRRLSDPQTPGRLAPTKGSHLILPRVAEHALFAQPHADGRLVFILPWDDDSLVGTTEAPVRSSLDTLAAEADEVDYLLQAVHRLLPASRLGADDVIATFAGARPLLAFAGEAGRASREHHIEVDRWGLVSLLGGKFTTYRRMAQQAVDLIVAQLRRRVDRCLAHDVSLVEPVEPISLERWRQVTRAIDPELLTRLLLRYGAGTFPILELISREPALAHTLCPHHPYIAAEVVHGLRGEMACTVTDVLTRRIRLAWSRCQGLDALSTVAELCARYGALAPAELDAQLAQYRRFLADGLAFRRARQEPAPAQAGPAMTPPVGEPL
jgi:glycerol-3-phosphate dehydrogenase